MKYKYALYLRIQPKDYIAFLDLYAELEMEKGSDRLRVVTLQEMTIDDANYSNITNKVQSLLMQRLRELFPVTDVYIAKDSNKRSIHYMYESSSLPGEPEKKRMKSSDGWRGRKRSKKSRRKRSTRGRR
jgi:hypothetical protein